MAVKAFAVRPSEAADGPAILALAGALDRWFNAEGLAQIERDLASHAGYVAMRDERLLGFITWNPLDAEVANLSWMGIAENLRHGGIGTVLLAALVTDLREREFRWLEVSTVADSVDYEPYVETRRFYRSRGFVDYRIDKGFFGPKDDPYDRLLLRLELKRDHPSHRGGGLSHDAHSWASPASRSRPLGMGLALPRRSEQTSPGERSILPRGPVKNL